MNISLKIHQWFKGIFPVLIKFLLKDEICFVSSLEDYSHKNSSFLLIFSLIKTFSIQILTCLIPSSHTVATLLHLNEISAQKRFHFHTKLLSGFINLASLFCHSLSSPLCVCKALTIMIPLSNALVMPFAVFFSLYFELLSLFALVSPQLFKE